MKKIRRFPTVALALLLLGGGLAEAGVKKFRKEQQRPVKLGTSVSNERDFELDPPFVSCATGTGGALLELVEEGQGAAAGSRYLVLGNNHVLSMLNSGKRGDLILQPGLLDSECAPGDPIAVFSAHKKIKFGNKLNDVDMAIAEVVEGAVQTNGKILRLGIPGNRTVEATPGLEVKKAGRTTGFTRGGTVIVTALDTEVEYASATGSGAAIRVASYRDQILVQGGNKPFHGPGDSGSVIYEDVKRCPRAVGLLFAGDVEGVFSVANRMDKVLQVAKKLRPRGEKVLVGCDPAPAPLAALAAGEDLVQRLARRAKDRHSEWVREIEGVVGIGVGRASDEPREAVVAILVERADPETLARIPTELDGVPTRVIESGRFKAF